METLLSKDQMLVLNEKFNLDLDYNDAVHYRAALVIWKISRSEKSLNDPDNKEEETGNPTKQS
jgi:hypothetical protein